MPKGIVVNTKKLSFPRQTARKCQSRYQDNRNTCIFETRCLLKYKTRASRGVLLVGCWFDMLFQFPSSDLLLSPLTIITTHYYHNTPIVYACCVREFLQSMSTAFELLRVCVCICIYVCVYCVFMFVLAACVYVVCTEANVCINMYKVFMYTFTYVHYMNMRTREWEIEKKGNIHVCEGEEEQERIWSAPKCSV